MMAMSNCSLRRYRFYFWEDHHWIRFKRFRPNSEWMSFLFEPTVLTLEQSVYSRWLLLFSSLLFVSISGLRLNCGLRNCTPFNGCSSCCQWFSDLFIAPYSWLLLLLLNRAWVHVQSRQAATHKLSLTWRRSQAKKKKSVCVLHLDADGSIAPNGIFPGVERCLPDCCTLKWSSMLLLSLLLNTQIIVCCH